MTLITGEYVAPDRGANDMYRASAHSGVPTSTLHYWARKGIYEPSISPGPRDRLWSWNDLLALRLIDWLRRDKGHGQPSRTPMREIRTALEQIRGMGLHRSHLVWVISVGMDGALFVTSDIETVRAAPGRQGAMVGMLNLVHPYRGAPDLLRPAPLLRIIPGKLHGEPHVVDTRIPSIVLFDFNRQGYSTRDIQAMFLEASEDAIVEAVAFERSLERHQAVA